MKLCALLVDDARCPADTDLSALREHCIRKVSELTGNITLLNPRQPLKNLPTLQADTGNALLQWIADQGEDTEVLILNAYAALVDLHSTRAMLEEQRRLAFDYTYPENLPPGLLPEVINSGIAAFILHTLPGNAPLFKDSIRELFQADLSSYDTNIFISPCRLIQYRLNFTPATYNDVLVMQAILEKYGHDHDMLTLEKHLEEDPLIMRGRPTYYEIQLTTIREQGELWLSDLSHREGTLPLSDFQAILEEISRFSHNPVVLLGFHGEPFAHPDISSIIRLLSGYPEIRFLFESRGLLSDFAPVTQALALDNVEVIFDLSFVQAESYARYKTPLQKDRSLLPLDILEQEIRGLSPASRVYLQFTRTTLNDGELFRFYQKWSGYTIIVQRPDTFYGAHQHLQVVDLAPIRKSFCYHLKHDILILSDGTVALNRYDVEGGRSPGHILRDGIQAVWEAQGRLYERQWASGFTDAEAGCDYDGWWVFNF